MDLTESEARFVNKLQKFQRWWPRTRWLCLAGSLATMGSYGYFLNYFVSYPVGSPEDAAAIGWASPILWGCFMAGCGLLGFTLGNWRGNLKTRLLLKLIEEHTNAKS